MDRNWTTWKISMKIKMKMKMVEIGQLVHKYEAIYVIKNNKYEDTTH